MAKGKWYGPGGADQSAADAMPADALSGQTFYGHDVGLKTGTMPDNGAVAVILATLSETYSPAAGYHNGSGTVTSQVTPVPKYATGTLWTDSEDTTATVSGLPFKPCAFAILTNSWGPSGSKMSGSSVFALLRPNGTYLAWEGRGSASGHGDSFSISSETIVWNASGFVVPALPNWSYAYFAVGV